MENKFIDFDYFDFRKIIVLDIANNHYPNLLNIDIDRNLYLSTPGDLLYKNLLISSFLEIKTKILDNMAV